MSRPTARRGAVSVTERHRAWLQLVETDGPFLAVPPVKRVWSAGMPPVDAARLDALRGGKPAFEAAYDEVTAALGRDVAPEQRAEALSAYRPARDEWAETVLRDVLGWGDLLHLDMSGTHAAPSAALPDDARALLDRATVTSDSGAVTRRPTGAMLHDGRPGALVWVVDPVEDSVHPLRQLLDDGWAHSPIDAMVEMLRAGEVPIGVVTDGRWWGLVSAPRPGTPTVLTTRADDTATLPSSGVVDSLTWIEEADARDAFIHLLDAQRLVAGRPEDRLTALFVESVAAAEEITVSLGVQVRRAVELLVQAFSESAAETRRRGLPDPLPIGEDGSADDVYQGAVTVMMRVVFLLFAQERGLLPTSAVFTESYGVVGVLDDLDRRAREEGEDSLDATKLTWHRLLATSNALYRGASFEDLRLPAYGGSLFDPRRFPFLEATIDDGTLAVTVTDRVMRHVLHAVQVAVVKGEARRVSFREIDVEQIGYIYEQLLGFTARTVETIQVGLLGPQGNEAEIPVDVLDDLADAQVTDEKIAAAIAAWVAQDQPSAKLPTRRTLVKALAAADDDGAAADRLLRAVTRDDAVRQRLKPWFGIIRRDLRDRPTVFLPGGLVVEETPSRQSAGAHYTPRALAEEVVEHALAPLVYHPGPHQTGERDTWRLRSSSEITDLRIADIACGSGAFLVAAARYLAKRLVEAWEREGITTSAGRQVEIDAIREIVAHCLYGADINPMAVEMCKLSLWLVSLDPRLPFSFVDDKLFCGHSLLGVTDLRQVEELHLYPAQPEGGPLQSRFELTHDNRLVDRLDVTHTIRRVLALRRQLASQVDDSEPHRSSRAKERQLAELHQVTWTLRRVADAVIAAGLPLGGKPGRALSEAYESLRLAVEAAYPASGDPDPAWLDHIVEQGLTPTVTTDYDRWQPLHWAIEIPDIMERGGFDAIVGNPPFLGGKKISRDQGKQVREYLVQCLAQGCKGECDLMGYFLLRSAQICSGSSIGLIGTNSLGQGETRRVALEPLLQAGFSIFRSVRSRPWPTCANVSFAILWIARNLAPSAPRVSDGEPVERIPGSFDPSAPDLWTAARLPENLQLSFMGCILSGQGFVLDGIPDEWRGIRDLQLVVRPFVGNDAINDAPGNRVERKVIDFFPLSFEEAEADWGPVLDVVRERVWPDRSTNRKKSYRQNWWLFAENCPGLRRAIADKVSCLAITLTSDTLMPVRMATDQVFSNSVGVIALEAFHDLTAISSGFHYVWALERGSTLQEGYRYTPSEVFETFPRPEATSRAEKVGRVLHEERREIMLRRQLGLTKLYNLVNDPDIQGDPDVDRMREIHVEVDEAVLEAYGWTDVPLNHGFHTYRQMRRWTVCPQARVEILDRLLEENHRRATLEARGETSPTSSDTDGDEAADELTTADEGSER